ncbi:hypothetical protein JB92DRAFT_2834151 [Gautieria morchelliformis]|nr:hypothetical protein JB92DRAFT_2834151 [Gautieria morchelliformis]
MYSDVWGSDSKEVHMRRAPPRWQIHRAVYLVQAHKISQVGMSTYQKHPRKQQRIHRAPTSHGEGSGSSSANLVPYIEDPEIDDTRLGWPPGFGIDAHKCEDDLRDAGTGGQPPDSHTPFEDGTFKLLLNFDESYPNKPPRDCFIQMYTTPMVNSGSTFSTPSTFSKTGGTPTYDVASCTLMLAEHNAVVLTCIALASLSRNTHSQRPCVAPSSGFDLQCYPRRYTLAHKDTNH